MQRFFVPEEWIERGGVVLRTEQAHQIARVLRLKPDDRIIVLDNSGWEYEVQLHRVNVEAVQGKVVAKRLCPNEPKVRIVLYQALLKKDKFELVLQKGVELGVSAFVPVISERCVAQHPGRDKVARWQRIVQEAAEQSGRGTLPRLQPPLSLKDACRLAGGPGILLWEGEHAVSLRRLLRNPAFRATAALSVFVGPEGGFPDSEVEYARSRGMAVVGLGPRILRAETAGLVAISAILYEMGELEASAPDGWLPLT